MYQEITIIGHLTRDPEMRYTPSGVPVTNFGVAVNRTWTNDQGEQQEKTTFFRVTTWRKHAETAAKYLVKGKLVMVKGEVGVSTYTDKSGDCKGSLELTASFFKMLGGRGEGQGAPTGGEPAIGAGGSDFNEDEIPF